ncbi:MAG: hydantoinase B/oxoprolinase family protein [Candidatus Rokubacteria bacterium]|nr:hydantoinase B/oxoprolinase family protein [Candidatus Rokubacteria bacterium]
MSQVRVDPITLAVIWGGLQSIAVEIGTTVHKTAYSEQAREGQDFSVAVFDPAGRMVAQGPYSPGHMGAMSFAVRNALAAHPAETLKPGDAILLNDPLLGSGHLPDFFITQPAFARGRLIGFVVNILHHTDVGGQRPGSQGVVGIFDYFQEGLRIPPTKVWKEYQEDPGLIGIIAANTRTPEKVLGDLRAQRSALRVGELRLVELVERYGAETVFAAMDEIMDRTEQNMRAAIRRIPNGTYTFEDFLDDFGPGTDPLRVAVTVTVKDDTVNIDYAGSSPQTASGLNSYINYTRSYSYAAIKCLTDPYGPMNEGVLRPISIEAPVGSFLNPRPPAGGGPRAIICYRTFEAVIGALAPALPERVLAASSHFANPTFGGFDPKRNRRFVAYELILSGTGAREGKDGCEALASAFNASNIPVEAQEANHPIIVERFEFIRDSSGPGRFRGGSGVRRDMKFLAKEGKLTNLAERQRFAPYGLFGGKPGKRGRTVINPGPNERVLHGKESCEFEDGDVISFQQPGAGGYGDPTTRDPAKVLDDVLNDFISLETAREAYGVVIDPKTSTVDAAATAKRRDQIRIRGTPPVVTR